MSWYAYSTRIYVNMCRVVEEYLVVVVFEGAEASHDVFVGLHHLKDVARIRKLGGASRMFDAAAHARHRVDQHLPLLFVVRDLVLERALKRFDVDGMLDKLG